LKNYLNNLVKQTLEKSSPGLFHQTIENIAFINSSTMLADVIKSLPKSDEFQQLRLGMVIFKLLGYGDSKIFKEKNSWGIPLIIRRETDLNFCLGYVKGIFKTAMPEKFNNLDFKIMESPVAISVEFL
jgi:hypothetical protein